jgi:hypothetical protein
LVDSVLPEPDSPIAFFSVYNNENQVNNNIPKQSLNKN